MVPIFIIVGSPAVGKSTTSHVLAKHFPKCIHIPTDDIRMMVASGLQLPGPDWSDELVQQIRLARNSVAYVATCYHQAGYAVVIDDFWDDNLDSDYERIMAEKHIHKIVLYPIQQEAHARNAKRAKNSVEQSYIDEGIRLVYARLTDAMVQLQQQNWVFLDTTALSVEDTVRTILQQTGMTGTSV